MTSEFLRCNIGSTVIKPDCPGGGKPHEEFVTYLSGQIEESKAETASLLAEGRSDNANFTKVRTNIYDVCRTVSQALMSRPGAGPGAIKAQLERFRAEWGAALEKARQHDNIRGMAVEETKLAALEDIIAHFQEVTEA